jgi:hypothetical protein
VLVVFGLTLWNWLYPFLRLESQLLNYAAFSALCLSIWLGLYPALTIRRDGLRVLTSMSVILVGLLALPLACIAAGATAVSLLSEPDPGLEVLASVPMGNQVVVIHRTNCGAPCAFGIGVRRERRILPGLLRVQQLPGFYPADTASYTVVDAHTIEISVPDYAPHRRSPVASRVYHLP